MIDVLVFLFALLVYAAATPHLAVRRYLPRLDADEAVVQQRYEAGYPRRRCLRLVAPALLVYFLLRAAFSSPDRGHFSDLVVPYFFAFGIVYVISFVCAVLWRYGWDRRFVAAHPEFADSLQPLKLRLLGPLVILAVFACVSFAISLRDPVAIFSLEGVALAVLILGRRFMTATIVQGRIPISPDSILGQTAAKVVREFGFEPKRIILAPSVVANAYALPNGSVMITTALNHIAKETEIAGILAHALSHAKDRDTRQLNRDRLLLFLLVLVTTIGVAIGVQFLPAGNTVTVPVAVAAMTTTVLFGLPIFARRSQSLQFKCDRAAREVGLGGELSSCLKKLHAYMGMPRHWLPGDARFLSHPSLDIRLAALQNSGDYPRPNIVA